MKVFRLEHRENRRGVYQADSDIYWRMSEEAGMRHDDRHPVAHDDSMLKHSFKARNLNLDMGVTLNGGFRFGFVSITQMRAWFYKDKGYAVMKDFGIVLRVYEIPEEDVFVGNTQTVFRTCHMESAPFETVELDTLVNNNFVI